MKFKITKEQIDILRRCAAKEADCYVMPSGVLLEPGERYNTEDASKPCSMNIALVTDDPLWGDTDLNDYARWTDFRKGVELTPDGRGVFDFYIRRRGDQTGELQGNVVLHVTNGEMAMITGFCDPKVLWTKEGGFA